MNLKNILPVIFSTLAICSCSKNLETTPEINNLQEEDYTIPIEDALSSLEDFMIDRGMVMTKGGVADYIDNYFTVSAPGTKASCAKENVLYAVNFKEESGYALLSADSRITEEILAVTDQGCISESDFEKPIFERIPTDNDDLSVSEYDEMVASGVLAEPQQNLINLEIMSYASRQIYHDDIEIIHSPCDPSGPTGGRGGGGSNPVTYSWQTVKEVPRMLNTLWTQSTKNNDIFNKYCPTVGLFVKRKAPAGCVCIALSQIIAYHEYPANLTCNGMKIDYPSIKNIYYYEDEGVHGTGTEISREMLARFCINVGSWCNTKYHSIFGISWGFAWPSDAKSCLELFGYRNVSLNWDYNENQVLNSLDRGCPVFMSAIAGFLQGHAWVIDGYMKRNYVSNKGNVSKSQTLVHCNWGWLGDCNGYFTSGVFHTQEAVMHDAGLDLDMDENYWCAFNTITYDKP